MPVFSYVSKDFEGNYHRGEVETADERQAANLLRRKKLILISLKARSEGGNQFLDKFLNRVSFTDVVIITRQLATMIQAGMILSDALDILEDQQQNKRLKRILKGISDSIKGGADFASAVEKHPDVFPPLYAKLIRAGQASGKLDLVLLDLATTLEKEREFKSRVKGAMIYPVVVITMMVGVMMVMIFFVMPKLTGLYKESGVDLPLPTQIVMGITQIMLDFWWAMAIGGVAVFLFLKRYLSTAEGKFMFDKLILKVPVIGGMSQMVIITSFTRTFALLVTSGVSILESIRIVSDIVGNKVYKNHLDIAYKGVERGLTFSGQLLSMPVFPKIVGQMVKTGEETGKLDEVMYKVADYFESETDHALKNATTLIEPLVLVVLGLGVGFLVISIILPIYQLTTNIR